MYTYNNITFVYSLFGNLIIFHFLAIFWCIHIWRFKMAR